MTMVILAIIMWAMIGGAISYIVKKKARCYSGYGLALSYVYHRDDDPC